ncbi:MAG TPA: hypothetical protein VM165_21280 [Planctomycetaceae bacterium]|nr:hypothetical protein [Planctomycetaceae bacterium]
MSSENKYWFPAKRYGWGWGPPTAWQGWAVLIGFVVLLVVVAIVFPPDRELVSYLMSVGALLAVLIAICWRTGAPPRWRWGED